MSYDKLDFPLNLDSFRQVPPTDDPQRITFQNYYPVSQKLRETCQILQVNMTCSELQQQIQTVMKACSLDSLYEDGKINIYPMKNTIDLKKSLGKKMKKIAKKTEKAILSIAHKMIKGTAPNASSKQ